MKRIIVLLLTSALLLSGCAINVENGGTPSGKESKTPIEGGVLNLSTYPPDTLNPLATQYSSVRDFLYLVYESLFVVEEDLSAKGVLASGYTASEGNTVYTVDIAEGIKFHSGAPLPAADVTATFEYIQKYPSVYAENLADVASYRAKGNSVVITLKTPKADFVNNLDFPILPKGLTGADFAEANENFTPNGTGRYRYLKTNRYKSVELEKNPDWRGADRVYIPSVAVRYLKDNDSMLYAFNSGETDLITTDRGRWGEFSYTGNMRTFEVTGTKYVYMGLNTRSSAFADSELRDALNTVIDKDVLIDGALFSHAEPARSPITPKAYFAGEKTVKTAKKTVEEKKSFLKQKNLSFYLMYNEESSRKKEIAELIKTQLAECGTDVVLSAVDFQTYCDRVASGNYQAYIGEVEIGADSDLGFMFNRAPVTVTSEDGETEQNVPSEPSGTALSDFSSSELDSAIANLNAAADKNSRSVAYKNLADYFAANLPQIPLLHMNDAMFSSKRIKGKIGKNLTNFYADLGDIYIDYKTN